MLDGIEAEQASADRFPHRDRHLGLGEVLQQAQNLDILPLAAMAEAGFEQTAELGKVRVQLPALQRCRLLQGAGLLLEQR